MDGTNKFRILIYSDHFYPSIGGSENYAMDLAKELSRQGHTVGLITAEQSTESDHFPFQVYRFEKALSIHRINFNFLEIPQVIKRFNPDIFHISYQTGGENFLIPLIKAMKISIILTYHADHVVTLGRMIDEMQMISTFKLVDMILVQSKRDMKKMMGRGISKDIIRLENFNGIDMIKYKCDLDPSNNIGTRLNLVCIARLDDSHRYKGIDRLIETALEARYLFDSNQIILNIIGEGNLRVKYEKILKRNNLPNLNFLGQLSDKDLVKTLCSSDFLMLSSTDKAEGFGRVAVEAMACGIPVIVSKYAGVSELIEKYNSGFVYDPYGKVNVFQIALNLRKSYSYILSIIQEGRLMISSEGLSLDCAVERTVNYYKEMIRNGKA